MTPRSCLLSALLAIAAGAVPAQQLPADLTLVGGTPSVLVPNLGLGSGGVSDKATRLLWHDTGCRTRGGVHIQCNASGVKLTFPSARELLFAADGYLHLRCGARGGPFLAGAELQLGDGTAVRIVLNPAQTVRVREVTVLDADTQLRPWRDGAAVRETGRAAAWAGPRLVCAGAGDRLYRGIALGPLVTLERVLAPTGDAAPTQHLALLADPVLQALQRLPRQHRTAEPSVRTLVADLETMLAEATTRWATSQDLPRLSFTEALWRLPDGTTLQFLPDDATPRLRLQAPVTHKLMAELRLGISPAVFLADPSPQEHGEIAVRGNGVRIPTGAASLQAKSELLERIPALRVLRAISSPAR